MLATGTVGILSAVCVLAVSAAGDSREQGLVASPLRCEYLVDPLGIDVTEPRLSWVLQSDVRGQKQTAYRVLVAASEDALAGDNGDLWDSGRVHSGRSVHLPYGGRPLKSEMRCYWKVRLWDKDGKDGAWSEPAMWSIGLLDEADWQAQWIGPAPDDFDTRLKDPPIPPSPLLRRSFRIEGQIERATLYATALGCYELRINGVRVGDHILAPEWTDYNKRVQYQTYDVTRLLRRGDNVVGATLADGWYLGRLGLVDLDPNFPRRGYYGKDRRLRVRLVIETQNGTRETICSDGSWKCWGDGPIRSADLFLGETYDARREQAGWDRPGFDDSGWETVVVDASVRRRLVAQMSEPIRVVTELRPTALSEPQPRIYVFDMGQNMVGWCRVHLHGLAGAIVTLRHAERLNPDGTVYVKNLRSADQVDTVILDGGPAREFEPHFTYHGFRYVQVEGLADKPSLESLTGCVLASDTKAVGTFECSNPMLNQLWRNILWTQRGNMHSTPTDCPQRSERMGWMGDAQIFSQTAIFNMDMAAFFTKWLRDIRDGQAPDGRFPDFAPHLESPQNRFYNAPGWADAGVIVPWRMYVNYGDRRLLERHYDAAKRYVDRIVAGNADLIWRRDTGNHYGDWLNGDTLNLEGYPKEGGAVARDVFATAFFAHSTDLVARMAAALGRADDARHYATLASRVRTTFQRQYVSDGAKIAGDTQSAYALALHFDLLPQSMRARAVEHLLTAIERYDGRLSSGIQSTARLMLELTRGGHDDLAYRLIESRRCPSWLYMIDQGATTIWERWDGFVEGRGFQDAGMNSFNHYALGAVGEWMYRTIVGIRPDEQRPGYKHVIIHPCPGGSVTWAKGTYDSIHGRIAVKWERDRGDWLLDVTVPANTTGTAYVQADDVARVRESGVPLAVGQGIRSVQSRDGHVVIELESGRYQFAVSGQP